MPTVYKVFTNKRTLLKASVEAAVTDGEAGEVERQPGSASSSKSPPPRASCASSLATRGECTTARGNCSKSYAPRQRVIAI